ncbi:MAG: acetate--CoA ligase family protein [Alphaproteobacteria bacterium]
MDNRHIETADLRRQRQENLVRLMQPRHIAFIGGRQVAGPVSMCRRGGFKGEIWVVNPTRDEIAGIRCVPSIDALPDAPDATLLALSPERSIAAIEQLRAMGAPAAVCMVAGFAELNEAGKVLQARLAEAAGPMAVMGPNCLGMMNQFDGAAVWGSEGHIEPQPEGHAGCAIISQSGAFLLGMTGIEQGFPLGYAFSIGNQAVIDTADYIEAALRDDRVRAIGLYLEGLIDGEALGQACVNAMRKGVPVIAIKGGDSPAGATVALSHTAAMVVERDLWDAFRDRYGIVEVSSPKALVESLKLLTVGGLPNGNRVSFASFSGGLNGLLAAKSPDHGIVLPPPTPENAKTMRALLPETVPIHNPLDVNLPYTSSTGISLDDGPAVARGLTLLARDAADQLVFFIDVPRPDENGFDRIWQPSIEAVGIARKTLGIPCTVAGIMPEGLDVGLRRRLLADGVTPLLGMSETLEALSVSIRLAEIHKTARNGPPPPALHPSAAVLKGVMLDEAESKRLLKMAGLQTMDYAVAVPSEAAAMADLLGYPVALKVLSDTIAHKARVGGVKLNLASADAVTRAAAEIASAVEASPEGHPVTHLLIERMIDAPVAEYIFGIKRHPALGLALMIGIGGGRVEQLRRYETILLPATDREIETALTRIGLPAGSPGFDSMKTAADAVARFASDHRDTLVTLDVNPVILTADNEAVAADALIVLSRS